MTAAMCAATATLETVLDARRALARVVGYGPTMLPPMVVHPSGVPDNVRLRAANTTAADTSGHGRWHRLVIDGFTLQLNDADQARQLIADAQAETDRQGAEAMRPRERVPRITLIPR